MLHVQSDTLANDGVQCHDGLRIKKLSLSLLGLHATFCY